MPFTGWQNFFVIMGSSAGALIGLQFVVMTLVSEIPMNKDIQRAGSAFATPTIVHFAAVLLLSAVSCAPWHTLWGAAGVWGVLGIAGLFYMIIVIRRVRRQTVYSLEFEDWLCHIFLPLVGYGLLVASAGAVLGKFRGALFGGGASVLVLLFTSIHNAWDAVTYHVYVNRHKHRNAQPSKE